MSTDLTLFQIADEYLTDLATLEDLDMPPEVVAHTLEGMDGELTEKATSVAMFVRNLEATALAIAQAEKDMAQRRKAIQYRAEQIRDYLKYNMQRTGKTIIECPYFKLSIRKNPPQVKITGPVPPEMMRQPPIPEMEPDKARIAEYIKKHGDVDWARLEQGERLEIR